MSLWRCAMVLFSYVDLLISGNGQTCEKCDFATCNCHEELRCLDSSQTMYTGAKNILIKAQEALINHHSTLEAAAAESNKGLLEEAKKSVEAIGGHIQTVTAGVAVGMNHIAATIGKKRGLFEAADPSAEPVPPTKMGRDM